MAPPQRRSTGFIAVGAAACAACAGVARMGQSLAAGAFVAPRGAVGRGASSGAVARQAVDLSDPKALEEMMKDPEKMKSIQADMEKIMADPSKKKAMEEWGQQIEGAVSKLKEDPEMKEFFEDIEKNGMDAMKKYEKDERILRKFSQATGGPESIGSMMGMGMPGAGGAAPPVPGQVAAYKPGDEVIIRGLKAKPELNGRKAMVVPPTSEERESLAGTGRLIVRLIDSGDQFAVKPDNLRTIEQEAGEAIGGSLEDLSPYNPAIQTEAAKLRESGKLEDLQNDPELQPIFEDIKKNGMSALEKYWDDEKLMAKISKAMGTR